VALAVRGSIRTVPAGQHYPLESDEKSSEDRTIKGGRGGRRAKPRIPDSQEEKSLLSHMGGTNSTEKKGFRGGLEGNSNFFQRKCWGERLGVGGGGGDCEIWAQGLKTKRKIPGGGVPQRATHKSVCKTPKKDTGERGQKKKKTKKKRPT